MTVLHIKIDYALSCDFPVRAYCIDLQGFMAGDLTQFGACCRLIPGPSASDASSGPLRPGSANHDVALIFSTHGVPGPRDSLSSMSETSMATLPHSADAHQASDRSALRPHGRAAGHTGSDSPDYRVGAASPPNKSHERSPELDLLRFLAASAVVFYHYTYRPAIHGVPSISAYGATQELSRYGYLGVPLFFLISGFVISWSAEGRTPGQFASARFKRLYPMFWIGMTLTLIVVAITGGRPYLLHPGVIAANLTMLPGRFASESIDGVYWTLAIEMKFYVYMFILIAARQIPKLEWWLYAWLAALLCATSRPDIHALASLTILPYGFYFVGGALSYIIRSRGLNLGRVLAILVCLVTSAFYEIKASAEFTTAPLLANPAVVVSLLALCYVLIVAVAVRSFKLPAPGLMFALGSLTYPLYLLHNVIGKELSRSLEPVLGDWARVLVIASLAYGLAWICASWIEPWVRAGIGRGMRYLDVVPAVLRRRTVRESK